MALPMPPVPPVTTATFPASCALLKTLTPHGETYVNLSLEGSMDDIFKRIESLVPSMIERILKGDYVEQPQSGEASFYSRSDAG